MQLLQQLSFLLLHHLDFGVQLIGLVNFGIEFGAIGINYFVEVGFALLLFDFVKVDFMGHDGSPEVLFVFVYIKASLVIQLSQKLHLTLNSLFL